MAAKVGLVATMATGNMQRAEKDSPYPLNYPIAAVVLSQMGITDGPFSLPLALTAAAIALAINIALAAALHRFVDMPSMQAGRRIQSSIGSIWPRPSAKSPAVQAA